MIEQRSRAMQEDLKKKKQFGYFVLPPWLYSIPSPSSFLRPSLSEETELPLFNICYATPV
jgi:hypothetical protein